MKFIHTVFPIGHFVISLLFVFCALAIILFALLQLWQGIQPGTGLPINERLNAILESIAMLTVAVAALELGQTIFEEEVQREANISAPTRVRRFLSRFMIVLVVALSIETLVLVFRMSHEAPELLPYVAAIGLAAAALLAAWGVFIRLNISAEKLEPEGIEEAKQEDEKVE
jgi:preprotein translocase subunit SecG